MALAYVEDHFAAMGLTPFGTDGYRTAFSFELWLQTGPSTLEWDGEPLVEGDDFGLLGGSGSGDITGALVFAGYGLTVPPFDAATYPECPLPAAGYDDYGALDVTGKVVLVLRHGPAGDAAVHDHCPANAAAQTNTGALWNFGYKTANAALHGALGAIIVNRFGQPDATPIMGTLGEAYEDQDFVATSAHRQRVAERLPDLASWQQTVDDTLAPASTETGISVTLKATTSRETRETHNLIAKVEGSDPTLAEEVILFGAHVDHLGINAVTGEPFVGADDNASGTAVMMELARALHAGLVQPKRTVVLASFNAEEEGLIGSCSYVTKPSHPIGKTRAMVSIDMVGAGNATGLDLYGADGKSFDWLTDVMNASAGAMALDLTAGTAPPLDASDHACFALAGVPAVMATSRGTHAYYHTEDDTPDTIRADDLLSSVRLIWALLVPLGLGQEGDYATVPASMPMGPWLDRVKPPIERAPRPDAAMTNRPRAGLRVLR